ncbi:MAG: RdgB/HAM1 family non-canonical purine NTP pyrophosphatase [Candidatus Omnitrophica bacterium]|nr:RdgB/HAM1 family non-canonical purine NTP pyrophosphatase [Candidatus Omnitrophota bacterium]MDD5654390.1 RdgB/HAM1 family non-canonical purine NTP pyrophosphatase [Candidatus Omnitrophota bacterium]
MKRPIPLELVVATKNRKKLQEIRRILKGLGLKITSLADYPVHPRIVENGKTFKENAVKKAAKIAVYTGKLTLGEDSGLCVEALGGLPGIYSARFSGGSKDDRSNNRKLLRLLGDLPIGKRKASYFCAAALADEKGLVGVVEGECRGRIGFVPKGRSGFGYDPLFIIPEYKKTFAQLGPGIKHKMSHRFRALQKARKIIAKYLKPAR